MSSNEGKNVNLYRFEYIEELCNSVDWLWLEPEEVKDFRANDPDVVLVSLRKATEEEEDLYNEAFADGYGLGSVETEFKKSNQVYYLFTGLKGDMELQTEKIFTCGECRVRSINFEEKASMFGPYYITKEVDDILWYVCVDCVGK